MLPPTDSISLAISSADRVFVPLSSILAISCVMPLFVRRFRQHAAFEHRAKFHERQPMVFFHQQPQAVGQVKFLRSADLPLAAVDAGAFGAVPLGSKAYKVRLFGRQIFPRHALQLRGVTRLTAAR